VKNRGPEERRSALPGFGSTGILREKNRGPEERRSALPGFGSTGIYVRRTADLKNVGPRYPASVGPAFYL
jgi:hypothetical protein